tara:strand:- start:510 stop:719 length:210 start_codon:yes stop_codon:yes gene_type:complete
LLSVDKLILEVKQHYPDEPVSAMTYLMETYDLEAIAATQLVSSIWNALHMKHPHNLPKFAVHPFSIFKN